MITNTDSTTNFTSPLQYGNFVDLVTKGHLVDAMKDVYLTGYFYILWTRLPDIMANEVESIGNFKEMARVLHNAVEIPGRELTTTEVTTSFGGASKLPIPTGIQTGNDLSINYNELSGIPMMKFNERWITAIRDPISGISDIPNYSLTTISGDLLYITTKPVHYDLQGSYSKEKGTPSNTQIVETAHFFKNVYPINDPQELFSANLESSDKIDVRIQYKFSNMFTGPEARKFAAAKLSEMIKVKDTGGYEIDADGLINPIYK